MTAERLDGASTGKPATANPSFEITRILNLIDSNALATRMLLRLQVPLISGGHSYVLVLNPGEGRTNIVLGLLPQRQDIFDDPAFIAENRKRFVRAKYGEDAHLLRVGELEITEDRIIERGGLGLVEGSDMALHAVLQAYGNGRTNNLGFHNP